MISHSYYWKKGLLREADKLHKRLEQKRWTERSVINIEKDLFLSFYSIRKLIEAKRLTDSVVQYSLPVVSYPNSGRNVTLLNCSEPSDFYNFSLPQKEKLDLVFVCNLFIHSYLFFISFDENGVLDGVLVNSDRTRNKSMWGISVVEIIRTFKMVGNDKVTHSHYTYDERTQDYKGKNY